MNTLKIEAALAKKYKYKPLAENLSEKYRSYFRDNIPEWLKETGQNQPLYTNRGSIITNRYERIVVGDYGAFVEFSEPIFEGQFIIAPGQEYRVFDDRYSKNIKYEWLTIDDGSNVKIYFQKRTVNYADYKPNMYYVSVHEVYPAGGLLEATVALQRAMSDSKATMPCEVCIHYPPSACDGKPCCICDSDNIYLNCFEDVREYRNKK